MYDDNFGTYENDDFGYEPFEDDLQEFSDREAFEDMVAERDTQRENDFESDFDGSFNDYAEDRYLDSSFEDRYDISHLEPPDYDY